MTLRVLAIALFSTLAACSWGDKQITWSDKFLEAPAEDGVAEPKEWVAVTDWSNPEVVTVLITEYEFQPSRLVLQAGKPYNLKIINRGAFKHTSRYWLCRPTSPSSSRRRYLGRSDR